MTRKDAVARFALSVGLLVASCALAQDNSSLINQALDQTVKMQFDTVLPEAMNEIAHATEEYLHVQGCRTFVFDGDNVRHGLCAGLGFSREDRDENIRRVGEMAKLFIEA